MFICFPRRACFIHPLLLWKRAEFQVEKDQNPSNYLTLDKSLSLARPGVLTCKYSEWPRKMLMSSSESDEPVTSTAGIQDKCSSPLNIPMRATPEHQVAKPDSLARQI